MKFLSKWKEWKEIASVAIIVGVGYIWFSHVNTGLAQASEKYDKLEDIVNQQTAITTKLDNQFYMLLQLHGISEDKIKQWKEMPKEPPFDSTGRPILRTTWLWISPDFQQGKLMQFDSVWVQEVQAWNLEARK